MITKEKLSWFGYRFVFIFAIITAVLACFNWYQIYTNSYNLNTVLMNNSLAIASVSALLVLVVLPNIKLGVKKK